MGWVRTKALTTERPSAPTLTWWLSAGILMAIIGVLLFILHASGTIKTLSAMNIWWVSLTPTGCWLLAFCLQCWLWDRNLKEYQFLQKEAERGQLMWEAWAGRYLAVLGSTGCCRMMFQRQTGEKNVPSNMGLPAELLTFRQKNQHS